MPTIAIGSSVDGGAGPAPLGRRRRRLPAQFGRRMSAERGGGRVVEDQGGGQPQPGRGAQPVAQLDRGQRVEAQVPEGAVGLDGLGAGVAEHGGGLGARPGRAAACPARRGQAGQPVGAAGVAGRGRSPRRRRRGSPRLGQVASSGLGAADGERAARAGPSRCRRPRRASSPASERLRRARRAPARVPSRGMPSPAQLRRSAERRRPCRRRAHRPQATEVAGSPRGPAVLGQRVEEGVGRRVVALARRRRARPRRGEQHERVQVAVRGQLVAGCSAAVRPWAAAPRRSRSGVRRVEHAVVEHAGRVHHGRSAGASAGSASSSAASASRSATSQAATVTWAPSAVSSAAQLGRAGRRRPAAAGEHQVLGAARRPASGRPGRRGRRCRR